jgi:hypothetical protein
VVGWEGFFGLCYLSVALAVMYHVPVGDDTCQGHPDEDLLMNAYLVFPIYTSICTYIYIV